MKVIVVATDELIEGNNELEILQEMSGTNFGNPLTPKQYMEIVSHRLKVMGMGDDIPINDPQEFLEWLEKHQLIRIFF